MFKELFEAKLPSGDLTQETINKYSSFIAKEYTKAVKKMNPEANYFQDLVDEIIDRAKKEGHQTKIKKVSPIIGELYVESFENYEDTRHCVASDYVDYQLEIGNNKVLVSVTQQPTVKLSTKNGKILFDVWYDDEELYLHAEVNGEDLLSGEVWTDEDIDTIMDALK